MSENTMPNRMSGPKSSWTNVWVNYKAGDYLILQKDQSFAGLKKGDLVVVQRPDQVTTESFDKPVVPVAKVGDDGEPGLGYWCYEEYLLPEVSQEDVEAAIRSIKEASNV